MSGEPIPGVHVMLENTYQGGVTDGNGRVVVQDIPTGLHTLVLSFIGYKTYRTSYTFPLADTARFYVIHLVTADHEIEVVEITSTRTNSRIEDMPLKVEVVAQEDLEEESTVVPGNISSILCDLSVITIQHVGAVNGNDAIRMQGLDPKYTQIMRDGLPLYGGFSSSIGVLCIPPLDLKQVEIIKGSASTLYGGGAIGGLINFISKTPEDSSRAILTLNETSLMETNVNSFFSGKKGKMGFTLFGGANVKSAADINKDGFSEVPSDKNYIFHPRLFFDLSKKSKLNLGVNSIYDDRSGGDMFAILHGADTIHPFLEKEKTLRNTVDVSFSHSTNGRHFFTFRTAGSEFSRAMDYHGFSFDGTQYSSYTEANDLIKFSRHTVVAGFNVTSESFRKNKSDSVAFGNYDYYTLGSFIQDDWQIAEKVSVQSGLRYDHQNQHGSFVLPRLSVFYKPGAHWSVRLAAGTGYKIPNLFDVATPSSSLLNNAAVITPERSFGVNADINYHAFLFDVVGVQVNQALYYTNITNPVVLTANAFGQQVLGNGSFSVNSYGTDTYVRLSYKEVELYLGYNHTEALQVFSSATLNMPFNPKDKLSGTLAYSVEGKWRMGVEWCSTKNQYIEDNKRVHDFLIFAAMLERKFAHGSIVLNSENLGDIRQSKFEKIVEGSAKDPVFKPIWGPLEGRVINLSLKLSL